MEIVTISGACAHLIKAAAVCRVLRDETEWVELVEAGLNRLAASTEASSVAGRTGKEVSPCGAGDAANRIVQRLMSDLN